MSDVKQYWVDSFELTDAATHNPPYVGPGLEPSVVVSASDYDALAQQLAQACKERDELKHDIEKSMTVSNIYLNEVDILQAELAEANRKLKNYEPIALYNGKSIEQYAVELAETKANGVAHAWRADALQAELTACREASEAMRAALEGMLLHFGKPKRDEYINEQAWKDSLVKVAAAHVALKPSDASTTERESESDA